VIHGWGAPHISHGGDGNRRELRSESRPPAEERIVPMEKKMKKRFRSEERRETGVATENYNQQSKIIIGMEGGQKSEKARPIQNRRSSRTPRGSPSDEREGDLPGKGLIVRLLVQTALQKDLQRNRGSKKDWNGH